MRIHRFKDRNELLHHFLGCIATAILIARREIDGLNARWRTYDPTPSEDTVEFSHNPDRPNGHEFLPFGGFLEFHSQIVLDKRTCINNCPNLHPIYPVWYI
jgi:hypothetical protein